MKRLMYETIDINGNLNSMYINHAVEFELCVYGHNPYMPPTGDMFTPQWRYANVVDHHVMDEFYYKENEREQRGRAFSDRLDRLRRIAKERLMFKLRAPSHRIFAHPSINPVRWQHRKDLAELVRAMVKTHGKPVKMAEGPQTDNAIAAIASSSAAKGNLGFDTLTRINGPRYSDIARALETNLNRISTGEWRPPVWAGENWARNHPMTYLHCVHTSVDDPTLISYTQSGDKLMRDVQTRVKPGRYLQQFFGDVLSETEIRDWANKQIEANAPIKVTFYDNKSPDLWVWAYEHGSGFSSCMVYNHPYDRYLHTDLHGANHPVRVYCHPDNDLALAVIGENLGNDGGRVFARAIVNQATKHWVRLYGDDRLRPALEALGYRRNSCCTEGQLLTCNEFRGAYIMPYLDGDVTNVTLTSHKGAEVFRIDEDGEYDGQNSNGLLGRPERTCCDECGEHTDDDDLTYVEYSDIRVCSGCLDDNWQYAYGRRSLDYYPEGDCVCCESDGYYYYLPYIGYHDIMECAATDNYYKLNELVLCSYGSYEDEYIHHDRVSELPDGEFCHEDDYDDVMAEHFSKDDEDNESDDEDNESDDKTDAPVVTTTEPAGDEQFAIAA